MSESPTLELSWKKYSKSGIDELVAELRGKVEVKEGEIAFRGVDVQGLLAVLSMSVTFPREVPATSRSRIISTAVQRAFSIPTVNRGRLLEEIRKAAAADAARPLRRFAIVGRLAVAPGIAPGSRRLPVGMVKFVSRVPEWAVERLDHGVDQRERAYSGVVVRALGREAAEALCSFADAMDVLRGCWNLAHNYCGVTYNSGGTRPQNTFRWGSRWVARDEGESELSPMWWEDPDHAPPIIVPSLSRVEWVELYRTERWTMQRLRDGRHGEYLTEMLRRYARVLDERNPIRAILGMWALLEYLTGRRLAYDETIRRAASCFREPASTRMELECLRAFRNDEIHGGVPFLRDELDAQALLGRLKPVVDVICRRHLHDLSNFESLDEAFEVLELGANPVKLQRELRARRRAVRLAQLAAKVARSEGLTTEATG